ncbi:TniQ family protein [Cereibacter sphaeroides]|nr:TniQ family protein [Cereibacter sphaeroides]
MHLVPVLPMLEGETLMSYVSRVGRFHAKRGPFEFLDLIHMRRRAVVEGALDALNRLSDMTSLPQERLAAGAIAAHSNRIYLLGAERFHSDFAPRDTVTYCPACLLDDRNNPVTRGQRVGRTEWLLRPTRTCPRHKIRLVRRPAAVGTASNFLDMEVLAGSDEELSELAASLARREMSPLQHYVAQRLLGIPGPTWLDEQQLDHGVRSAEMIGACLKLGADFRGQDLSEDDWDMAGRIGFAHVARGAEGIREALSILHERFLGSNGEGGPHQALGSLYEWLQLPRFAERSWPIAEVVRNFILDTYAIEPGKMLFGVQVAERRRHSVATLATATGLHPKTLNRALVITGVISSGDPDVIDGRGSFEAGAGEELARRIRDSIPTAQIPAYLGCNRTQAQELVRSGLLPRIAMREGKQYGMLSNVPLAEVDAFLQRFRSAGRSVATASAGMMDVIAASEAARWPTLDIVWLVLEGKLERVEVLEPELKFVSVLVDPLEVREKTRVKEADVGVDQATAARMLGIMSSGLSYLVSNADRDGRPFISYIPVRNSAGTERRYFGPRELDRFKERYVHLKDVARQEGVLPRIMRKRLSDLGIQPIAPRNIVNAMLYRRSDI